LAARVLVQALLLAQENVQPNALFQRLLPT
jgi:hypothetical protein